MPKPIKRGHVWYSDYREGGKRIRRPLSRDKREAQAMLDERMALRRVGKWGGYMREMRWLIFKERYLEYSRINKKISTFKQDEYYLRLMEGTLSVRNISEVTPEYLERLRVLWTGQGRSESTITLACMIVKIAMHKAEEWKFIHPQNWRSVKLKKIKGRELYFTLEELRTLVALAPGLWRTAILLMAKAGLRRGETLTLTWKDVDFKNDRLLIRTKELPDGTIWTTKSGKDRMIPLDIELRANLESHARPSGFVLDGIKDTDNSFYWGIKNFLKMAGLGGSPHTLRHSFGSHLAMAGVPLIQIRELLGHANIETVQIYAHLSPESTRMAMTQMPKLVGSMLGSK